MKYPIKVLLLLLLPLLIALATPQIGVAQNKNDQTEEKEKEPKEKKAKKEKKTKKDKKAKKEKKTKKDKKAKKEKEPKEKKAKKEKEPKEKKAKKEKEPKEKKAKKEKESKEDSPKEVKDEAPKNQRQEADRYGRVYGKRGRSSSRTNTGPLASVKLIPAMYWSTIGLEYEHTVGKSFTIALKGYYNYGGFGSNQNYTTTNPDYLEPGYLIDLLGKYYFFQTAQSGPYAFLGASYGDILNYDGSYRPFSLFNRRSQVNDLSSETTYAQPEPYHFTFGGGYQVILSHRGLTGNIAAGISTSFEQEGDIALGLYIEPGIGITFGGGGK